jgi:accessory gene regulator protein AgrB
MYFFSFSDITRDYVNIKYCIEALILLVKFAVTDRTILGNFSRIATNSAHNRQNVMCNLRRIVFVVDVAFIPS